MIRQNYKVGDDLTDKPGTVTLTSNAGTLNKRAGVITTESLSTAGGSSQDLTITDSEVAADDLVLVTWIGGTNTAGTPVFKAVPGAGSFVITAYNKHASTAFSGTFKLAFQIVKNG